MDVPLGKMVLRFGAEVTKKTEVKAAGKTAPFDSLRAGARAGIQFRRSVTGDDAIPLLILRGPRG